MIDPLLRRVVPANTSQTAAEPSAPAAATTPPAPVHADGLLPTQRQSGPVSLDGAARSSRISLPPFLDDLFGPRGPRLIHLKDGWTPQGQGYDAGRGELLTTYYKDAGDDAGVLLSFQDKQTGRESRHVRLGGKDGVPAPSHGGGVSTDGEFVYVADTDRIYVYSREAILKAEASRAEVEPLHTTKVPPDTVDPVTGIELISNGSFMTVKDGQAYVGAYSKNGDGKVGAVWRYDVDPRTGSLIEGSRQGPIRAPDRAQGMAVVDGALLFTTGDHKLMYQPFDAQTFEADIGRRVDIGNGRIDPYVQGFNIIDGEVWVTYESGSDKYKDKVLNPREHIQRIPLDRLNLKAAGLTPDDLQG